MTETKKKLEDGLHWFKAPKKRRVYMFVKNGEMWMPTEILGIVSFMIGCEITIIGKRGFIRAREIIKEMPEYEPAMVKLAETYGLKL